MIELTLREIKPDHFIVRGDKVSSTIQKLIHYSPDTSIYEVPLDDSHENVIKFIGQMPQNTLIYAIGNQVGAGQEILEMISAYRNYG